MSLSDLSSMTDLPFGGKKKTHRGRRSRGHGVKPDAAMHHKTLNAAMAAGDHGKAKSASLMLANALHAKMKATTPPAVPSSGEPDTDDAGTMAPPMGGGMNGPVGGMGAAGGGGLPFSKPF